jgi:zinc protease
MSLLAICLRIAIVFIGMLPVYTNAQTVPSNLTLPVPMNPKVYSGTLPNGMKYFVLKNDKPANRVEMMLAVNVGSVLEDEDQRGLAHFCEHMAFNGTKSFPKQQLVSFLESTGIRFGADLNAYTNQDETVYLLTIPTDKPNNLETGLNVLRDWSRFVNYADKDINDERGVVVEEWRLRSNAQERVFDLHRPVLYHQSPYADRRPIGDTGVLLRCPTENLRRFYHTWYRPESMAIVVVGDMDPTAMVERIKRTFTVEGSTTYPKKERPSMSLPYHERTLISIVKEKEIPTASIDVIWKRRPFSTATYEGIRLAIAHQLISTMLALRTQEISRKPNPPFLYSALQYGNIVRETGAVIASSAPADKNVLRSLSAMMTELYRAERHGFTAGELERAKQSVLSNMEQAYNERDKSESQPFAQELVRHFLTGESVPGIEVELAIFRSMMPTITTEELKKVLADEIAPNNRVVMLSMPEGGGYTIPTEEEVSNLLKAVESKTIAAYVDQAVEKQLLASTPAPGKIASKENIKEIDAVKLTLSNGATVLYKKTDFKNDEILFSATSWGGTNYTDLGNLNNARLAAQIIDECGIADFDASALSRMLTGKNLSISPTISEDAEGFTGQSTPKDIKTLFELLHLYFVAPRKDKDAFTSLTQKVRTQLENKDKNPEAVFQDSLMAILTNYHPRAKPISVADIDAMDLDKVYAFYRQRFANPGDFTFSFVGNIETDEFERYVTQYLASVPGSSTRETYKDNGVRSTKGVIKRTVVRGTENKSTVVMTLHGPMSYGPKERYDITALCEVMGIRLREQLREEKGGTYTVAVIPQMEKLPEEEYAIMVYFGCDPSRVEELTKAVSSEIENMKNSLVDQIYIDKVREIQLKEREVSMKRNSFWMSVIRQFTRDQEPYSNVYLRDGYIKALSPEVVREAARKYLNTPNTTTVILMPERS